MTSRRLASAPFLAFAATIGACASSAGYPGWDEVSTHAIPERDATAPARPIDCRTYNDRTLLPGYTSVSILVPVVVGVDGLVSGSGAAQVYPREEYDSAAPRLGEATRIAEACVFEPATLDGDPVAVRRFVRFSYSVPGS